MSDTNVRGITGLAPRKVDPKRMLAANRDADPNATPSSSEESAAPGATETPRDAAQGAPAAPKPSTSGRTTTRNTAAPAQGAQGRVNSYIDAQARARVVAAYKATSHLEGDESFSAFVETALVNEAIRREELYNDGEEFVATGNLQRGRPVRG